MGTVSVPSFGADPVTITGPTLDAKVDGLASEFNGNIDDDNIAADATIANSKLNLATIAQNIAHSGTMNHTGAVTLSAATTMSSKDFSEAKGADVASDATTTIWVTDGNFIHITGTTTITSFGTAQQAGDERTVVFDGALILTHNATSLILPTGANITTAAGDTAIVRAETTANARVIAYNRKDGTNLGGIGTLTTQGDILYRDSSANARLGAGTVGQMLKTGGAGANPSWVFPAYIKVGTYTGTSAEQTVTVGFTDTSITPKCVIVKSSGAREAMFRVTNHPANNSSFFSGSADNTTQGIKSFAANSFTVGTLDQANASGDTFWFVAVG